MEYGLISITSMSNFMIFLKSKGKILNQKSNIAMWLMALKGNCLKDFTFCTLCISVKIELLLLSKGNVHMGKRANNLPPRNDFCLRIVHSSYFMLSSEDCKAMIV